MSFGCHRFDQKINEIFLRISALASKKRLNQKLYYTKYVIVKQRLRDNSIICFAINNVILHHLKMTQHLRYHIARAYFNESGKPIIIKYVLFSKIHQFITSIQTGNSYSKWACTKFILFTKFVKNFRWVYLSYFIKLSEFKVEFLHGLEIGNTKWSDKTSSHSLFYHSNRWEYHQYWNHSGLPMKSQSMQIPVKRNPTK